jgi:dTDP-4-amino-4,6-dideoxygalactose transaminase
VVSSAISTWAQCTLQVENRAEFQADLKDSGVPTAIYRPVPLSRQKAYRHFLSAPTPISEALSQTVVSLPMHPYLDEGTQDRVIAQF